MIEAMLIGLLLGATCVLLDHAAQWANAQLVEEWRELGGGLIVGSCMFGPPVILSWCTSQTADWLLAVAAAWAVLALSGPSVAELARRY